MKIGVWLNEAILPNIGGGASYTNRLLTLIDGYKFSEGVEICYVTLFPNKALSREIVNVSQLPSICYKLFSFSSRLFSFLQRIDIKLIKIRGLDTILKSYNIKIIYYVQQGTIVDSDFPFISTNWDIGHRSTYSFPELCKKNLFEKRDHFYMDVLPKALMVVCESESGKKELMSYTNLGAHMIRVMPIFAGGVSSLEVTDKEMDEILDSLGVVKLSYYYYPAQFWAHKNHIGLLRAFKKFVKEKNPDFRLVLSGSDKGNLSYIKKCVEEMGLNGQVIFLGFVSEKKVYTLYKNAVCLIMASHFGPTNMPPIEAMEIGCPVACSDLSGHREILGDSAVYFDSFDYLSIYDSMVEIYEHRELYMTKINKKKHSTIFNSSYAVACLDKIFLEAVNIRSNWE